MVYKKSELMLMRCTRAYASSFSQLILVYLHPFRRTSLFCSQKSHKITKKPLFSRSCLVLVHDCWFIKPSIMNAVKRNYLLKPFNWSCRNLATIPSR